MCGSHRIVYRGPSNRQLICGSDHGEITLLIWLKLSSPRGQAYRVSAVAHSLPNALGYVREGNDKLSVVADLSLIAISVCGLSLGELGLRSRVVSKRHRELVFASYHGSIGRDQGWIIIHHGRYVALIDQDALTVSSTEEARFD